MGDDRFQDDVAIGAVDDGGVIGVEIDRMSADPQGEIGSVGGAFDIEQIERAAEFSGGLQRAFETFDGAHVGVVEGEFGVDGGVARLVGIPGAKGADAIDFAEWDGIGDLGVEAGGLVEAEILNDDALEREIARRLLGIVAQDGDEAVLDLNFVDEDWIFIGEIDVGAGDARAGAAAFGRDVDLQAVEDDFVDGVAAAEQIGKAGGEGDALDLNQGRDVGAAFEAEGQAVDGDAGAGEKLDVEAGELDVTLEAGAEIGFGAGADLGAEERFRGDGGDGQEDKDYGDDGQPFAFG